MTLKCQGHEYKVHRCFVCSQSKPLAAAMDGRFKESTTGVINLEDDDPEIVEKMVQFFYTAEYNPTCSIDAISNPTPFRPAVDDVDSSTQNLLAESTDKALQSAVKIYIIGDKYDVVGLKAFAKRNFVSLLIMGTMTMDGFTKALSIIYNCLPDSDVGLKDAALEWLGAEKNLDYALKCAVFKEFCEADGEVAFDISKRVRNFQVTLGIKK